MAGTADRAEPARPEGGGRVPEAGRDRSLEALQRQVTALGVPRFEVGIREAKTGQMMNREWDRAELEQAVPWLKRMNAKGNDVYIRPAGEHGLVLVDDVKPAALERMKREGFAPTATVETSTGNFQAWVMLSAKPLPPDVRHLAARMLAQRYDGDMNSTDSRHYGRLAGFTNQKPEHTRNGKQPFVLARDCSGKAAGAAPALLESIGQLIDREGARKEREGRLEAIRTVRQGHGGHDPVREYQQQAQRLMAKYGDKADLSRMDWMIATDMAKSGRFTAQDIEKGLRECSPNVESRKAGHIEDYARRTAAKAWDAPEVQAHRQEQAQTWQAERDRGQGWSR
ncbi:MAG: DNA topoisomerase [Rhodoferax sp.]|nr:DNA topoisomerase [Rhodoferax sp.]